MSTSDRCYATATAPSRAFASQNLLGGRHRGDPGAQRDSATPSQTSTPFADLETNDKGSGSIDRCTSQALSAVPPFDPARSRPHTLACLVTKVDSSSGSEVVTGQALAELLTHGKNRCILVIAPVGATTVDRARFRDLAGTISGTIMGTIAFV
jgi:hypothetical protein